MPQLKAKSVDLLFAFDEVNPRLAAVVQPAMFALYAAPAVNLFEKTTDRIPVSRTSTSTTSCPTAAASSTSSRTASSTSSPTIPAARRRCRSIRSIQRRPRQRPARRGCSTRMRRLPRRRTVEERRIRRAVATIPAPTCSSRWSSRPASTTTTGVARAQRARAVLEPPPDRAPAGRRGRRRLPPARRHVTLDVVCVAGPTPPREPVVAQLRSRTRDRAIPARSTWRLDQHAEPQPSRPRRARRRRNAPGAARDAVAVRRPLRQRDRAADPRHAQRRQPADRAPAAPARAASAPRAASRSPSRSTRRPSRAAASSCSARCSTASSPNTPRSTTSPQTVIRTVERGEIMRWPPRVGARRPL